MSVCTSEDGHVRELQYDRRTVVWAAELSDGRTVWMDDFRPGVSPHSAWLRLAACLAEGHESVVRLWLKFHANTYRPPAPYRPDGWFFSKSVVRTSALGESLSFYLVGWLTGGELRVQRVAVPELTLVDESVRDPDRAGPCLILNPR